MNFELFPQGRLGCQRQTDTLLGLFTEYVDNNKNMEIWKYGIYQAYLLIVFFFFGITELTDRVLIYRLQCRTFSPEIPNNYVRAAWHVAAKRAECVWRAVAL